MEEFSSTLATFAAFRNYGLMQLVLLGSCIALVAIIHIATVLDQCYSGCECGLIPAGKFLFMYCSGFVKLDVHSLGFVAVWLQFMALATGSGAIRNLCFESPAETVCLSDGRFNILG